MTPQQSLSNFYDGVKLTHPRTAALMHTDILKVAIFASAEDKSPAQESANNLRNSAKDLPAPLLEVLENALVGLGFPDDR